MSSVCSGNTMRSSSRRFCASNRHSSTFSALAENNAKLVPRPSQVAPSGCGTPPATRPLELRNGEQRSKRRKDKADLRNPAVLGSRDGAGVSHIGAAVNGGIAVEHLAPAAAERNLDAVIAADL